MTKRILFTFLSLLFVNCFQIQSQVVFYGKIDNQLWFENTDANILQPNVLKLYPDNLLQSKMPLLIVPDEQGYYHANLPVNYPVPVFVEYNNSRLQLFFIPGDTLLLNFDAADLVQHASVWGSAALYNSLLIQYQQRYNLEDIENEVARKKELNDRHNYFNYCEDRYILVKAFTDKLLQQRQYPDAFVTWLNAELTYQKANRLSAFYYKSENPLQDDYFSFVGKYNLHDASACVSNQYLLFLENHLRHLSMRDEIAVRIERQNNRVPWVVRGYELAKIHYTGLAREIMLTRMMMDIAGVQYSGTNTIYADYLQQNVYEGLRALAAQQYQQYTETVQALKLPDGAELTVMPNDATFILQDLMMPYQGKVVYIVFWATWCMPCIYNIQNTAQFRKEYESKGVVFLFLSLDQSVEMWRSKIASLNLTGVHYLLSPLFIDYAAKIWNLAEIPRYMQVSKNGILVNADAPHPGSNESIITLENLLGER